MGERTGELCIICSVETKVATAFLTESELIPAMIRGIPTDVQPVGIIHSLQSPTGRFRPVPGGVSTGHVHVTAGTLGCMVKRGDRNYILSNNHVLANSNKAVKGDMIIQPGRFDGGSVTDDRIAMLTGFVPISFEKEPGCRFINGLTGIFNVFLRLSGSRTRLYSQRRLQDENLADCAIAEPLDQGDFVNEILQVGTISGTGRGGPWDENKKKRKDNRPDQGNN
jgi:hypothetical protein